MVLTLQYCSKPRILFRFGRTVATGERLKGDSATPGPVGNLGFEGIRLDHAQATTAVTAKDSTTLRRSIGTIELANSE